MDFGFQGKLQESEIKQSYPDKDTEEEAFKRVEIMQNNNTASKKGIKENQN